jgi:hypothetical protein
MRSAAAGVGRARVEGDFILTKSETDVIDIPIGGIQLPLGASRTGRREVVCLKRSSYLQPTREPDPEEIFLLESGRNPLKSPDSEK